MNLDAFSVMHDFADFNNNQMMAGYQSFSGQPRRQQFPFRQQGMRRMPQQQTRGEVKKFRRFARTSFPFSPINDSVEHKSFTVTRDTVHCFHGPRSVLTLQHRWNFLIDGNQYKSVDQYYQMNKVKDLTGLESAKFTDSSTKNYSALAKDLLRQYKIPKDKVDKWRIERGVFLIQKALLEKLRQCDEYKSALIKTGDKIIAQSYAGDDFFGAGVPFKYVKDWCDGMGKNKVSIKFPMTFPITGEALKGVPTIGKGRNVLGAIHMSLREKVNNSSVDGLDVTMDEIFIGDNANNGTATGVNQKTESMNVDFTADIDADSTSKAGGGSPLVKSAVNQQQQKMKVPVGRIAGAN